MTENRKERITACPRCAGSVDLRNDVFVCRDCRGVYDAKTGESDEDATITAAFSDLHRHD